MPQPAIQCRFLFPDVRNSPTDATNENDPGPESVTISQRVYRNGFTGKGVVWRGLQVSEQD